MSAPTVNSETPEGAPEYSVTGTAPALTTLRVPRPFIEAAISLTAVSTSASYCFMPEDRSIIIVISA